MKKLNCVGIPKLVYPELPINEDSEDEPWNSELLTKLPGLRDTEFATLDNWLANPVFLPLSSVKS